MKKGDFVIKATRDKGNACFANRAFKKGEKVANFAGKVYRGKDNPRNFNSSNNHYLEIGEDDLYLGPSRTPDNYINHSCDPNAGLRINQKEIVLYAIKNIKKNEEITFDYSTDFYDDSIEPYLCRCGNAFCRRSIKSFGKLPKSLRKKYVKLNIAPEFVLRNTSK